jgi:hypothetical protein
LKPRRNHPQLIQALHTFGDALEALLAVSTRDDQYLGPGTVVPKPGREEEWSRRRSVVDRAAPAAARALAEAGIGVEWKPRGTFATFPVNPATEWATILSD